MFSRASAEYFNALPNTHVTEVDFGLPGALPVPNKLAVEKSIRLALALNCKINQKTNFDRKNYFYPDLGKGYQISQFDKPIGYDGFVEIEIGDDSRRIRVQRIHIEEDTAKSIHGEDGKTLIDFNKAGVPLAEIVTKPDFESTEEVIAFAKRLRQIVRYTDSSDAEMQKGQMRFELNISMKEVGAKELPKYQIEVKNIGSISVLEKVINFEIKRQTELLEKGEVIKKQTRGLKDMSGETLFQRFKETSDDYRYFPEPDIPPFEISDEWIEKLQNSMPELPVERKNRYVELGLEFEQADNFVEDIERGKYLDIVIEEVEKARSRDRAFNVRELIKEAANWISTDIAGHLEKRKIDWANCPVLPKDLIYLIQMMKDKKITGNIAKKVIEIIFVEGGNAEQIIKDKNLIQIEDESSVDTFIKQAIEQNPKVVADISKNPNAIKFLVGQVMKLSQGRVNPGTAESKLNERLKLKD
jgi:aspartyl-tRNA(Asn)/glutamyl-tRNA(Gln) amidotransferase subunit B